jgi:WD40 repeat protein
MVESVCIDERNNLIISGNWDDTIRVWDVSTSQCIHILADKTLGDRNNVVKIWNWITKKLTRVLFGRIKYSDCIHIVYSVCVDEKHNLIISEHWDGTIRVWNTLTGQLIHSFDSGYVDCMYIIAVHDNLIISGGYDNTIRVFDALTGRLVHILLGHTAAVRSVCFSQKHNQIISGSNDQTIRIWNLVTGELIRIFASGYIGVITSVAVHNNLIISGSNDGTIRVWDEETGKNIHTFVNPMRDVQSSVQSICVDKKNDQIIVLITYGMIEIWDLITGSFVRAFSSINTSSGHSHGVQSICLG